MWPWEHLAFGYLLYSGYVWVRHGEPPGDRPVVLLLFMTQFPDLVDKPLAWTFGVLPSGVSLAHSVLFAIPVIVVVALVSTRFDAPELAPAAAIGYLSHLLGDVLYPVFLGGGVAVWYLFWPLVPQTPDPATTFVFQFQRLLGVFVEFLATPRGRLYLGLELLALGGTFALWLRDGRPGLAIVRWFLRLVRPRRTAD